MLFGNNNSNPLQNMGRIFSPTAQRSLFGNGSTGNQIQNTTISQLPGNLNAASILNQAFPASSAPASMRRGAPLSSGSGQFQGLDGGKTDGMGVIRQTLAGIDARQNGRTSPYTNIRNWQNNQAMAQLLVDRDTSNRRRMEENVGS